MERQVDYRADPGHPAEVDVVGDALAEDDLRAGRDGGARGRGGRVDGRRGRCVRGS